MASDTPAETSHPESDSPTSTTNDEGRLTVNLQIVSPSLSVGRPLHFPVIAVSTTIKELKERIRSSLPLRPPDDHQRLIHRGRALVRETDTLLQIFGEDAVHSQEQQTMHLVVREQHNNQPTPTVNTATRGSGAPPSPASALNSQRPFPPPHPNSMAQPPPGFPRRNPTQPIMSPAYPSPHFETPQPAHAQFHQTQHQNMTAWINQVQRDAVSRAMHRNRQAATGMRPADGTETHSGRASPVLGHYHREHLGPQGQTIQVETIIRGTHGTTHVPGGPLTPADVHNLLRQADMSQATATMANAMQRSASSASLHNRFMQPMGTNHPHPLGDSRAGSGRATPDPAMRSTSGGNHSAGTGSTPTQGRTGYELYVLSSPEGPRALLVNNGSSETFYTPRLPTQSSYHRLRHLATQDGPLSENLLQPTHNSTQNNTPVAGPQQQNQAQNAQPGAFGNNDNAQANNAAAGAGLPPLLVQAWPHIWLAFRLGVFVWFFTSPASSWSRWLSVIGLAVLIFVLSIGAFNNLAGLLWRPVAQQLENMLPGLEPRPQAPPGDAQAQPGDAEEAHPDPADMAARLIAQQRDRETWIQGQIRRVERASLLFLASIAPGVAERHIANLEAEARVERHRQEAAAQQERLQEEAEQAAAQAEQAADGEGSGEGSPEQPNLDTQGSDERREGQANPDENHGGQPDLIAF